MRVKNFFQTIHKINNMFSASKNPILKNEVIIYEGDKIRLRLNLADYESDESCERFIAFLLEKLNS